MTEQDIFWAGRGPSADQPALPTDDPAFEAALRAVCETAGCPVQRYVAARGAFGSWLLELRRGEQAHRLIWNGQTSRLSMDAPNRGGGWDEISAECLDQADTETLHAAMQRMLTGADPGD